MKRIAPKYVLAAMVLALWPVLAWYVAGTLDGSNDAWGLLALATVAYLCIARAPAATARAMPKCRAPLALPALLLAAYVAATLAGAFIALRAVLAGLALAALLSSWRFGQRIHLPLFALCLLALPLAASVQFFLGYPLRVAAGSLSVALLQMNGLAVLREGTLLHWGGQTISIDAPCSGVKMLWTAMYLTYTLAAWQRFSMVQTMAAIVLGVSTVVLGNAVRASALFYTEAGLLHLPAWAHGAIGMVTFAGAVGLIVCGIHQIKEKLNGVAA